MDEKQQLDVAHGLFDGKGGGGGIVALLMSFLKNHHFTLTAANVTEAEALINGSPLPVYAKWLLMAALHFLASNPAQIPAAVAAAQAAP